MLGVLSSRIWGKDGRNLELTRGEERRRSLHGPEITWEVIGRGTALYIIFRILQWIHWDEGHRKKGLAERRGIRGMSKEVK